MKYKIIGSEEKYSERISAALEEEKKNMRGFYPHLSELFDKQFKNPDAKEGSLAVDLKDKVIARLKANPVKDKTWGNSLTSNLGDFFFNSSVISQNPVKDLYAAEFGAKTYEYCEHKIILPAYDKDKVWTWFELGFGLEQVYGFGDTKHLSQKSTAEIKIEKLSPANAGAFEKFYSIIAGMQAKAPVWAGAPANYLRALKKGFSEIVYDKEAIVYLAFDGPRAVAYQLWSPYSESIIELSVAGVVEEYRGKGIGKALTVFCANKVFDLGYKIVIADWRSTNPSSSTFWTAMGFQPYLYRLVRKFGAKTKLR